MHCFALKFSSLYLFMIFEICIIEKKYKKSQYIPFLFMTGKVKYRLKNNYDLWFDYLTVTVRSFSFYDWKS